MFECDNIVDTDQYNNHIYNLADTSDIKEDESKDLTEFTIFNEVDILQQMETGEKEISIVLSIPKTQASILLNKIEVLELTCMRKYPVHFQHYGAIVVWMYLLVDH